MPLDIGRGFSCAPSLFLLLLLLWRNEDLLWIWAVGGAYLHAGRKHQGFRGCLPVLVLFAPPSAVGVAFAHKDIDAFRTRDLCTRKTSTLELQLFGILRHPKNLSFAKLQ